MQTKYRMASWYWGNYCVRLDNGKYIDQCREVVNVSASDLEPYIEEEHGWHHSEEAKQGKPQFRD